MLEILNRYIHGYVAIPVIVACYQHRLFDLLAKEGPLTLKKLAQLTKANEGHLQVALRMFESLHWIKKSADRYSISISSDEYEKIRHIPADIIELYSIPIDSLLKKAQHKKNATKMVKLYD